MGPGRHMEDSHGIFLGPRIRPDPASVATAVWRENQKIEDFSVSLCLSKIKINLKEKKSLTQETMRQLASCYFLPTE